MSMPAIAAVDHPDRPLVLADYYESEGKSTVAEYYRRVADRSKRTHKRRESMTRAEAAKIPARKRHPHILKHTIALQTIHSAGIENVRQYLGHKSMSSTGAYLKVTDSEASTAISHALKSSLAV